MTTLYLSVHLCSFSEAIYIYTVNFLEKELFFFLKNNRVTIFSIDNLTENRNN